MEDSHGDRRSDPEGNEAQLKGAQYAPFRKRITEEGSSSHEASGLLARLEQALPGVGGRRGSNPSAHSQGHPEAVQGLSEAALTLIPETGPSAEALGHQQSAETAQGAASRPSRAPEPMAEEYPAARYRAHGARPDALARYERDCEDRSAHDVAPHGQGEVIADAGRDGRLGYELNLSGEEGWASDPGGGMPLGVHRQFGEGAGEGTGVGDGGERGEGGGGGGDVEGLCGQPQQYCFPPSSSNRSLPGRLEERVHHMGRGPSMPLTNEQAGDGDPATRSNEHVGRVPLATLTKERTWPLARREGAWSAGGDVMSSRDAALLQAVADQQSCRGDGVPPTIRFQARGIHSSEGGRELYPRFQETAGAAQERIPGVSDLDMDGAASVAGGDGFSQGSCAPAGDPEVLLAIRGGNAVMGIGNSDTRGEPGQIGNPASGQMETSRPLEVPFQSRAQAQELRDQSEAQVQEGQAMLQEMTSHHSDARAPEMWLGIGAGGTGRLTLCAASFSTGEVAGKGPKRGGGASGRFAGRGVSSGRAELIRRWQLQQQSSGAPQQQPEWQRQPQPEQLPPPQQDVHLYSQQHEQQYQQQVQQEQGPNQLHSTPLTRLPENPADAISDHGTRLPLTANDETAQELSAVPHIGVEALGPPGVPDAAPGARQAVAEAQAEAPRGVERELIQHLSLVKPEPGSLGEALLSSNRLALPFQMAATATEAVPRASVGHVTHPAAVLASLQNVSSGLRAQTAGVRPLNEQPPARTGAPPGNQAQVAAPGMPQRVTVVFERNGSSDDSLEVEGAHDRGAHPGSPATPKEGDVSTECQAQGRQKRIMRERERRSNVRVQLKRLRSLLPRELADDAAQDTVSLISTAVDYIKHLQNVAGAPLDE